MSSFFNIPGPRHTYQETITSGLADTAPRHDDLHDAETGPSTRYHIARQRRSYLTWHPNVGPASLPPVQDPTTACRTGTTQALSPVNLPTCDCEPSAAHVCSIAC